MPNERFRGGNNFSKGGNSSQVEKQGERTTYKDGVTKTGGRFSYDNNARRPYRDAKFHFEDLDKLCLEEYRDLNGRATGFKVESDYYVDLWNYFQTQEDEFKGCIKRAVESATDEVVTAKEITIQKGSVIVGIVLAVIGAVGVVGVTLAARNSLVSNLKATAMNFLSDFTTGAWDERKRKPTERKEDSSQKTTARPKEQESGGGLPQDWGTGKPENPCQPSPEAIQPKPLINEETNKTVIEDKNLFPAVKQILLEMMQSTQPLAVLAQVQATLRENIRKADVKELYRIWRAKAGLDEEISQRLRELYPEPIKEESAEKKEQAAQQAVADATSEEESKDKPRYIPKDATPSFLIKTNTTKQGDIDYVFIQWTEKFVDEDGKTKRRPEYIGLGRKNDLEVQIAIRESKEEASWLGKEIEREANKQNSKISKE